VCSPALGLLQGLASRSDRPLRDDEFRAAVVAEGSAAADRERQLHAAQLGGQLSGSELGQTIGADRPVAVLRSPQDRPIIEAKAIGSGLTDGEEYGLWPVNTSAVHQRPERS